MGSNVSFVSDSSRTRSCIQSRVLDLVEVARYVTENSSSGRDAIERQKLVVRHARLLYQVFTTDIVSSFNRIGM